MKNMPYIMPKKITVAKKHNCHTSQTYIITIFFGKIFNAFKSCSRPSKAG